MRSMGPKIRELMEARELTQAELARELGVSRARVWCWLHRDRFPTRTIQPKLAKILGTTVAALNGWSAS